MVNFNIFRKTPDSTDLRAYLYHLLSAGFALSYDIIDDLQSRNPHFNGDLPEGISLFSDPQIIEILERFKILPAEVFYFQNERIAEITRFEELPKAFTGIHFVTFEYNGLLVGEYYCGQIYRLFNSKGGSLTDYCHDIQIGAFGNILTRRSDSFLWDFYHYDGESLSDEGGFSNHELPDDFPYLNFGDIIPEMFAEGEFPIPANYPPDNLSESEVTRELSRNPHTYRYLAEYYFDNEHLAEVALDMVVEAFLLLSESLKSDKNFILQLLYKGNKHVELYRFFSEPLKSDPEIIKLCYQQFPSALERIAPIVDKKFAREALGHSPKNIKYLSDSLRSDPELILFAAAKDWGFLKFIGAELLLDKEFLLKAITTYNSAPQESDSKDNYDENDEAPDPFGDHFEKRSLDIYQLVSYLVREHRNSAYLQHIAPVSDKKLIFEILPCFWDKDVPQLLSFISNDIKEKREFWLEALACRSNVVKFFPAEHAEDRELIMEAIKKDGKNIGLIGERFREDPEIFLAALKQIKYNPKIILHLLPETLRNSVSFVEEAKRLGVRIDG